MQSQEDARVLFLETRVRSLIKAAIYRLISIAVTSVLSWLITRDIGQTITITLAIQVLLMVLYYSSERVWDRINWGRQVKIT